MAAETSNSRVNAFANCGAKLYVHARPDGSEHKITCSCCHDRFCEPCQQRRRRIIAAALEEVIAKRTVRFVTLTLRLSDCSLRDQMDRLYRSFSVLRRRTWWREHVDGGAAFCETKLGKNSLGWHVHLHLLVEGKFMPQRELSQEWNAVTGDSFIVDVRECRDPHGRAAYVTKYVTKPADSSVYANAAKLAEFIAAIKGRRLCTTFGTWRGIELDPERLPDGEWVSVGPVENVVRRAAAGDVECLRLVGLLSAKYPGLLPVLDRVERGDLPPPTS